MEEEVRKKWRRHKNAPEKWDDSNTPHARPFHSDLGIGSGDTGRFMPRCFPAPTNERGWFAGRMRTYGLPKRVTNNSSFISFCPFAIANKSAMLRWCLRNQH